MNESYTFEQLEKSVCTYDKKNWHKILKAYNYASEHHKGQKRASGEEYIIHPVSVAYLLSKLHADSDTICAALLHDCIEDTESTYEDIVSNFNETVAILVDGVTKMTQLKLKHDNLNALNLRRIILSLKKDVRIVIIKLVDRLHNMRTLQYKTKQSQNRIALETIEIYVPLAYYIGAYNIKDELENISFKYLKPDTYRELEIKLNTYHNEYKRMLHKMILETKSLLNREGIKCKLDIRYKDVYSVYKKMITKSTIDNIHDLIGIDVIVKNQKDCYLTLMYIHSLYKPVSYKFKDYIVNPKTNMYQALHTTVFSPNNRLIQFQIRTKNMENIARNGLTSYWFNNKNIAKELMQNDLENNFQFFKSIKELDSSISDNLEFVDQIKRELFSSNVYVRSTQGEIIELPDGSTPIDYAYKIHSDIGNNMVAAIVNDEYVPFDYKLKNDDRVKIITDNSAYVKKDDWLDKVMTTKARKKIQEFIKEHENLQNKEEK